MATSQPNTLFFTFTYWLNLTKKNNKKLTAEVTPNQNCSFIAFVRVPYIGIVRCSLNGLWAFIDEGIVK